MLANSTIVTFRFYKNIVATISTAGSIFELGNLMEEKEEQKPLRFGYMALVVSSSRSSLLRFDSGPMRMFFLLSLTAQGCRVYLRRNEMGFLSLTRHHG